MRSLSSFLGLLLFLELSLLLSSSESLIENWRGEMAVAGGVGDDDDLLVRVVNGCDAMQSGREQQGVNAAHECRLNKAKSKVIVVVSIVDR